MQLKGYLAAITRLWWLIVLIIISATTGSYLFTKLQPPVYRSSVLFITAARLDWGTTMTVQVLLRQQEEQLRTLSLASRVKERMGLDLAPGEIAAKVRTKSYADSISLRLDVEDSDPERARLIALGYGQLFEEQKAAEYAAAPPYDRISVKMLEEPAQAAQIGPNTRANLGAGAMMGLMLGLVLVLLLEYLDDTLKTPDDVRRYLGLATLGSIPGSDPAHRKRWGGQKEALAGEVRR